MTIKKTSCYMGGNVYMMCFHFAYFEIKHMS